MKLVFFSFSALVIAVGSPYADCIEDIVSVITGLPTDQIYPWHPEAVRKNIVFGTSFENLLTKFAQGEKNTEVIGRRIWIGLRNPDYGSSLTCGISSMEFSLKGYYGSCSTLSDIGGAFGSLGFGISRGNISSYLQGDFQSTRGSSILKIRKYGHSDDLEENIYFYNLLQSAFGSSIAYSLVNGKSSGAFAFSYGSDSGKFGFRVSRSDIVLDMEVRYESSIDEDLMGTRYVLADFNLSPIDLKVFYSLKIQGINCIFWGGAFLSKADFNIDPLNPKKKGEMYLDVIHLGDGKLKVNGKDLGVNLIWTRPSGRSFNGQFGLAKGDLSSSASVLTPVMGRGLSSFFIPVVHKAEGEASGSAFSQLYSLLFRTPLDRVLEFEGLLRFIYSTMKVNGQVDYDFYGIKVSSWSEDTTYRGGKLITISSKIRYRFRSSGDISLGISQHIPIKPKKVAKGPPGPPKRKRIRKKATGGPFLQLSLRCYL